MEPRTPHELPIEPVELTPLAQVEDEVEEDGEFTPSEFAKVEKNLVSLGFFTPSSKRIKDAKAKTVSINAVVNGNRIGVAPCHDTNS